MTDLCITINSEDNQYMELFVDIPGWEYMRPSHRRKALRNAILKNVRVDTHSMDAPEESMINLRL